MHFVTEAKNFLAMLYNDERKVLLAKLKQNSLKKRE